LSRVTPRRAGYAVRSLSLVSLARPGRVHDAGARLDAQRSRGYLVRARRWGTSSGFRDWASVTAFAAALACVFGASWLRSPGVQPANHFEHRLDDVDRAPCDLDARLAPHDVAHAGILAPIAMPASVSTR
jgi:hypothetical protein